MALSPGTRVGPYEVTAKIGQGGMGEVYRARETKLGRDVALKVLPDLFADDPERLARFQREARVLASLNHPNIASIYGLKELFYLGPGGNLMVVDLEADGDTPVAGIPQVLFPINGPTFVQPNHYDVTADGQRFLVNAFVEDAVTAPITWVVNWTAELEQ